MRFRYAIALAAIAAGFVVAGCQNSPNSVVSGPLQMSQPDKTGATYYYPPELWNGFVTIPSGSPTDFEIIFQGNVTADFPSPLEPGHGVYDPFCPPSQTCNNMTVTYNTSSNTTTFEWSGTQLYDNISGNSTEVHFGILNGPGGTYVKCLQWYTEWTFASGPPEPTPVINVCNKKKVKTKKSPAASTTVFATVFVETSFSPINASSPATSGTWVNIPYTSDGSTQPQLEYANYTDQPIYTANSGIVLNQSYPTDSSCLSNLYCSGNISDLEELNFEGMPPPGSEESPFIPMTNPPPSVIQPQGFK